MSKWTHLAGIIRLDNLSRLFPFGKRPREADILSCFKPDLPKGSEVGTRIGLHVWETTNSYERASDSLDLMYEGRSYWGDIIISADLRNVGDDPQDVQRIRGWFEESCDRLKKLTGIMIRQAILQIEVEFSSTYTLFLHSELEDDEWILQEAKWNEQA
jgi:hypothetical protein